MQLARATARHRELTIRAALGAGTARLARQLLIENAIVGVLGGVAGLLLAVALHAALPSLLPAGFPRVDAIAIDGPWCCSRWLLTVDHQPSPAASCRSCTCAVSSLRALAEGGMASGGAGQGRLRRDPRADRRQPGRRDVRAAGRRHPAGAQLPGAVTADRGYDPSNVLTAAIPFPAPTRSSGRRNARRDHRAAQEPARHHPCRRRHRVAAGFGRRLRAFKFHVAVRAAARGRGARPFVASSRPTISARLAFASSPAARSPTQTIAVPRRRWSSIARSSASTWTTSRSSAPLSQSLGMSACERAEGRGAYAHRRRRR